MTYEDAEKQLSADDEAARLSGDLEAYQKDMSGSWITAIPTAIGLGTAQALPVLEESLKAAIAPAAVAGGAVAATGVGAAVAVPVAEMTGTLTAAGWTADFITGQEYLRQRRRGIPHEQAKIDSTLVGVINGALAGVRFGQVAKVPVNTAQSILKAHATSVTNWLAEATRFGGIQLALNEASTATRLIFDAIGGTVSNVPDAIPTVQEAVEEFAKIFQDTLRTAPGFFLGGKAIGGTVGLGLRAVRKAHDTHMQRQRAKTEAIAKAIQLEQEQPELPEAPEAKPKEVSKRELAAQARREKRLQAEAEINRVIEAATSKFFIEQKETRVAETTRIQKLVKRMIKNSDQLEPNLKERLLERIPEIDSVKDLQRLGAQLVDDIRQGEYATQLKEAESRLKGIIEKSQPVKGKAKLPVQLQASMAWYREFFVEAKVKAEGEKFKAGEREAAVKEAGLKRATDALDSGIDEEIRNLQRQTEKLAKNELAEIYDAPESLLEKRRIAQQAVRFWSDSLTPEELDGISESLETAIKKGRTGFIARKQAEAQRRLNWREQVKNGVQGQKPVTPSTEAKPGRKMTAIAELANDLRRTSTSLWDKLLQDMPVDERERIVNRILDFTESENKESQIVLDSAEKLTGLYTKAAGTFREAERLIRHGLKEELFEEQYIDAEGNPQIIGRATTNQLVYLHMAMQDPSALPGLLSGNKYTLKGMVELGETSTQEAVQRILENRADGKYLKLAEAVQDFYRWFAPVVKNHYLREYGLELPTNEFYSGRLFHRQVEQVQDAVDLLDNVHNYMLQSLDPASVRLRKNSKLPVRLMDPFGQVTNHYREMAFWIANSEKARDQTFIFSDTSKDGLQDIISYKLSPEFLNLVKGRLAWQYHLRPGISKSVNRVYQQLKSNLATGFLGARFDQAPKQWTSILIALSTNTFGQFTSGLIKATQKNALAEYVANSRLYKDRQNQILPQILETTRDRNYLDRATADRLSKLKEFFLLPMTKGGDAVASRITGFIEFNRAREAGASVEAAALAGDRLVDKSQSSARPSQKAPLEFDRGIGALSGALQKQNIQMINLESSAIRDAFLHPDAQHMSRLVTTIAGIHTAQVLFQMINSVPAWVVGDEQDQKDNLIRIASAAVGGPYTQLPLIGWDVLASALATGIEGGRVREPRTIIGGIASDSFRLVQRMVKLTKKGVAGEDISSEETFKALKSLAATASVFTGIPFWGLFSIAEFAGKVGEKVAEGKPQ
jgi:hypothetical protein